MPATLLHRTSHTDGGLRNEPADTDPLRAHTLHTARCRGERGNAGAPVRRGRWRAFPAPWAAAALPGQTPFAVGAAEIVSNRTRQALRDAWVAEEDGMVLGAILAYRMTRAKVGTDQPYARLKTQALGSWYIDSLAVLEGRRRSGLGRSTLRAADDAARRGGCNRLSLLVYDSNPAAAALYARCGFVETHAHPLPPEHPTRARSLRLLQRESTCPERSPSGTLRQGRFPRT
ncbi:GNAT family N-acetyltransferase [Sulfitobacter sp. LCG007]